MIMMAITFSSLYPMLLYNENEVSNEDLMAFVIGAELCLAKSFVVTFFVFVAAPLCAEVIKIIRKSSGEKVHTDEIIAWSEQTILRFTKGILGSICIIPMIVIERIQFFAVALVTSPIIGFVFSEVGLRWWNVKKDVEQVVVDKVKRISMVPGFNRASRVEAESDHAPKLKNIRQSIKESYRSSDEWDLKIALLREHSFTDQFITLSCSCIILLRVAFPSPFYLEGYKSEEAQSLFTGELHGYFFRTLILIACERVEFYVIKYRIRRINPSFKNFQPVDISLLGYVQITTISAVACTLSFSCTR